jgi:glycyl-tRNA synthetase beta chain
MKQTLLVELGCEDLPARYVGPLSQALTQGFVAGLSRRGVTHSGAKTLATPRRIAVLIDGVVARQPEQNLERLGPALAATLKDGKPTPAALGFAKSCGVEFSTLGQKDGKLHFLKTVPGKATAELIPDIFEETLKQMDELVPKRMRWGSSEETFVRPVQWLLALLGESVIPLRRFGLESGRSTYGHRFHAPAAISLKSTADYEAALKAGKVWADVASRKQEIKRQIEAEAQKLGGRARITEDLLNEVTALVEWPVVISGRMEDRFMQLPPEVIVSTVETNQRYFTVFADDRFSKLLPFFITISNIESRDVSQVIAGNERVVRPRLSDAMFFWEQDLKQSLESYGARLATVTFQKELGTIADKVQRVRKLAVQIAGLIGEDAKTIERAATLCKNDLVTRMVYEFPELQGLMGGYYAEKSGESAAVATAIREHYLPTQQGTAIPSTRAGQIVSLADKLDSLAGIFAIGQKPTASKDPYALRRAALGVLRICIEGSLSIDLRALLKSALDAQPAGKRDATTLAELTDFVLERLRAYYEQLPVEMFEAVKALGISAPLDFDRRVRALKGFIGTPAAASLAAANKRIRNILRQSEVEARGNTLINTSLLEHAAEKQLADELAQLEKDVTPLRSVQDYPAMLARLAALKEPVDAFFAGVMVMADNPQVRTNRLALLGKLDALCREVADLSCLPG